MQKLLEKLVDKFFLRYCSIPIVIILCALFCIAYIPQSSDSSKFPLYRVLTIALLIALYSLFTIKNNSLPRARKDSKAVLFVIDSETSQQFDEVNFKLVKRFKDLLEESSTVKVDVKSIKRSKIKDYCVEDKSKMLRLLKKTNCIFVVDVVYIANEESDADNYEIDIRTGVVHPKYKQIANTILQNELNMLAKPLSISKFTKSEKIDRFKLTALSLAHVSQYIMGILFLFSGLTEKASECFDKLYSDLKFNSQDDSLFNWFKNAIPKKLFLIDIMLAEGKYKCYRRDKGKSDLDGMQKYLEMANSLFPNTYAYNLDMAILYILKHKDVKGALACINRCKAFKDKRYSSWRYSEAFLYAYKQASPLVVYRKYKTAFKYDCSIVDLASFIEDVLAQEPDKAMLHLALGLIYEKAQNVILMKYHLKLFINSTKNMKGYEQIRKIVDDKISLYNCSVNCDSNCQNCNLVA